MRKIFLLAYISFCSVYAQQSLNPNLITFPVSPEASRMTAYGNTPVNLFYGQLDKTVELFGGKTGEFSLPLNLNYNYAGFRLEETPSVVGLGWQLTAGGVISREVRGVPDEHPRGYYGGQQHIIGNYFNTGFLNQNLAKDLMSGEYDTEADLYHVAINGINFSFKIGLNGAPVFLNKQDYKLTVKYNPANPLEIVSFNLVDANGNNYIFSDREFTQRVQGHDAVFQDNFQKYVTSWQITQINTNEGRLISYAYDDDYFDSYSYYANGSLFYRTSSSGAIPVNTYELPDARYTEGNAKDLIERKILRYIRTDTYSVSFMRSISNAQDVYSSISISNITGDPVIVYKLTYSGLRNTLTKITRNDKLFYGFTYWGGNYPGFQNSILNFPRAQDYWGFYNGKHTNSYYINIPTSSYVADRRPDFGGTVNGALRSITYPTGGHTEIFYEQNTISEEILKSLDTEVNSTIDIEFKTDYPNASTNLKEWTFTKTFDTDVVAVLSHTIQVTPHSYLEVEINTLGGCPASPTNYYNRIPQLRNNETLPKTCLYLREYFADDGCSQDICSHSGNSGGKFVLPAGTYEFKFKTTKNQVFAKCNFKLEYYKPVSGVVTEKINAKTGGIRVKQTVDYPFEGLPITKHYDYNDDEGLSTAKALSTATNFIKYKHPLWDQDLYERTKDPSFPLSGTIFVQLPSYDNYYEYLSKPYNQLLNRSIPVYYTSVKEYNSKIVDFIPGKVLCGCSVSGNGGTYDYTHSTGTYRTKYPTGYKKTDFADPINADNPYPFVPAGADRSTGAVAQTNIYGPGNAQFKHAELTSDKLKYASFSYNNLNDENYPKSLRTGYKIRADRDVHSVNFVNNNFPYLSQVYHLVTYKESDYYAFEIERKTTEYFDEKPMKKLETKEYDGHRQLKKVNQINDLSNLSSKLTTELYYPYDFNDPISPMMALYNLKSPVVKVVKKRNDEITETTKFNYDHIGFGIFKPKSFSKSKGNYEPEILQNYSYDSKGNLTLMFKENIQQDIPQNLKNNRTIIIWGYNKSQIIAKIEGSELASIDSGVQQDLEQKSISDSDHCNQPDCTEEILRQALNNLRTLYPEAMVTTYTHDPLIGVTSVTDPRGLTSTYEYDDFGRLLRVKDHLGNILNENVYNYKLQN